jgi:RNA polymerase sigma-70 factor (ECF subfamily)
MTVIAGSASVPANRPSLDGAEFLALYDELAPVMFRVARQLGVQSDAVEDVVQEVFAVVHRRRDEFERRSTAKTWVTGIAIHVIKNFRRGLRRHDHKVAAVADAADFVAEPPRAPDDHAELSQASVFLNRFLDSLDDDRRAVFVLVELQQLSAPEVAELTETNLNTVYGRLRSARKLFEEAAAAFRAGKGSDR